MKGFKLFTLLSLIPFASTVALLEATPGRQPDKKHVVRKHNTKKQAPQKKAGWFNKMQDKKKTPHK